MKRSVPWFAALLIAMPAHAEGPGSQVAAQSLFQDAKELLKASKPAEACPKLEEVVRLEPQGNGARMMLAECYEATGKLASAWATYLAAESFAGRAGQADRAQRAKLRVDALAPKLSRMVIKVDPALDDLADLKVLRDGEVLGRAQWGAPVPVDGGDHYLEMRAQGYASHKRVVAVKTEGDLVTVELGRDAMVSLAPTTSASAPAPVPVPTAASSAVAQPPAPTAAAPDKRAWPLPLAVGGGIALLAGVAFYVDLRRVESRQSDLCGGDLKRCAATTPSYQPEDDNARKRRDFALFVGLGGLGAAALGAAAWGAWGGRTQVAVGPGGVSVARAF